MGSLLWRGGSMWMKFWLHWINRFVYRGWTREGIQHVDNERRVSREAIKFPKVKRDLRKEKKKKGEMGSPRYLKWNNTHIAKGAAAAVCHITEISVARSHDSWVAQAPTRFEVETPITPQRVRILIDCPWQCTKSVRVLGICDLWYAWGDLAAHCHCSYRV